ncbi:MAG: primosomal protein N' [Candidatus Omnitrophica bacterium]|nr:primosomal protein N' [Candidatus Omnitrophota bacterium]
MLFARIVFGLPVQGPFDYSLPDSLKQKAMPGTRAWVNFSYKKALGYIVDVSAKSKIKKVKPVLEMPDDAPVLSPAMLKLTREVSAYYGCSWGEAIETALPEAVRKAKKKLDLARYPVQTAARKPQATLVHDADKLQRWDMYKKAIKKTLEEARSVLFLNADLKQMSEAEDILANEFRCSVVPLHRRMPPAKCLENWLRIKNRQADIVLGVISAIFAPLENLGLIIIDEEESQNYKNDQTPHYNARDVALMRARIDKADTILAASSPSLEMMQLVRKKKIDYLTLAKKKFAQVHITDMLRQGRIFKKRDIIISSELQVALGQTLQNKGKALLFVNKRGFASLAFCRNCGFILHCPRCNAALTYHFRQNQLLCRYCNYAQEPPLLCPQCNSSYIRYTGQGIEKIESELHRLWPDAKIMKIDALQDLDIDAADIFISTQTVLKRKGLKFDLVGIVSLDNVLNRIDFRATEKAFGLLVEFSNLTDKSLFVQTHIPGHYCFQALAKGDADLFYNRELALRKQLDFPPFQHFICIKVRGKNAAKTEEKARQIFEELNKISEDRKTSVLSASPAQPSKLRDNFYWQVLIKSNNPKKAVKFIKNSLKNISHSGVIITLDVDPL